jgi:small nuclear ribonucleoprotein (snRNP)-like protein
MSAIGTGSTAAPTERTVAAGKKKSLSTLGHIFHYLEGMILMVELKTGQCYVGKQLSSSSSADMTLVLVDVLVLSPPQQHTNRSKLLQYYHQTISSQQQQQQQPPRGITTAPLILQLVHIRGSKIRYVHFVENVSINDLVQVGVHRERYAKQQYQRGIRK